MTEALDPLETPPLTDTEQRDDDQQTTEQGLTKDSEHTEEDNSKITPPGSPSSLLHSGTVLKEENDILIKKYCSACQVGDIVVVRELIESGVIDLGEDVDENNVSGLHWAAINNRLSVVKYLVEKGATIDLIGGELNATPLHWACRYGLVYIVDYLISKGADPTLKDGQGNNALHLAVQSSNIMLVIYVLVFVQEIDVDCLDPNNRTPLHWAAYQGDSLSVHTLLKFQASVKKIDAQDFTPLHWSMIRGSKDCIKKLIEEGSDIRAKATEGKDCFAMGKDMNTTDSLAQALRENGLDAQGNPVRLFMSGNTGKLLTFFIPYLIIGAVLQGLSQIGFVITLLLSLVGGVFTIQLFKRIIFPSYVLSHDPMFRSPLLAGVFSGTCFWIIIIWVSTLLPFTFKEMPLINFLFLSFTVFTLYSFQRAMFRNPGVIEPPSSNEEIKENIKSLLKSGKYDAKHFCIHTFVQKPLRSKYSSFYEKCVVRFDHACPWVYNDIGLRNHKVFMFFVVSLWVSIVLYFNLTAEYFDVIEQDDLRCSWLNDELCAGFNLSPFVFYLSMWTLFQFIWLSFLLFTQLVQISKGVTTLELSNFAKSELGPNQYYSSVPAELAVVGSQPTLTQTRKIKWYSKLCILTGLDQFILTLKESFGVKNSYSSAGLETDYGVKENCIDFWFASGDEDLKFRNVWKLPVSDEANLNGQRVNYYKLFELPEKNMVYDVGMV